MRWGAPISREKLFVAANAYASKQLELHAQYAKWANLAGLASSVGELQSRLAEVQSAGGCLLSIGYGGGFFSNSNVTVINRNVTINNFVNRGATTVVPAAVMTGSRPVAPSVQRVDPAQFARITLAPQFPAFFGVFDGCLRLTLTEAPLVNHQHRRLVLK